MRFFDTPQTQFNIASFFGETDLLTCVNRCKLQYGMYALVSPRTRRQLFIEIIYSCSYCDQMKITKYDIQRMKQYSNTEIEFVSRLINDVMVPYTDDNADMFRKKVDIISVNAKQSV